MITQMGMSDELGQVAWSSGSGQSFVGQQMGQPSDCSDATNSAIDDEIKSLVERAYRWGLQDLRQVAVWAAALHTCIDFLPRRSSRLSRASTVGIYRTCFKLQCGWQLGTYALVLLGLPLRSSCVDQLTVCECYRRRAKDLVQTNISILHRVAGVLLEKEQIDGDEFLRIMMEEQASQVNTATLSMHLQLLVNTYCVAAGFLFPLASWCLFQLVSPPMSPCCSLYKM